jgi:hypothetical protein
MTPGDRLGPYEVTALLGAGGPALVSDLVAMRELRRFPAVAPKRLNGAEAGSFAAASACANFDEVTP